MRTIRLNEQQSCHTRRPEYATCIDLRTGQEQLGSALSGTVGIGRLTAKNTSTDGVEVCNNTGGDLNAAGAMMLAETVTARLRLDEFGLIYQPLPELPELPDPVVLFFVVDFLVVLFLVGPLARTVALMRKLGVATYHSLKNPSP